VLVVCGLLVHVRLSEQSALHWHARERMAGSSELELGLPLAQLSPFVTTLTRCTRSFWDRVA
jgi:hypothetical protein